MTAGDPCWRGPDGVAVIDLPFRVVMPDGTTRTNPDEWSQDADVLAATGWRRDTLTADDVAAMTPLAPPSPPVWVTPAGWPLGLSDAEAGRLAALHYLAARRHAAGLPASVVVVDADGVEHVVAFADLDALLLEYAAAVEASNATA
jgi:nucleotide-binding universal stress UspA family protein